MKYTSVILIGSASANLMVEKIHHQCPVEAWFEHMDEKHVLHAKKEVCPKFDDNEMMTHREFMKSTHKTVINSLYKGWFHDARSEMIPDTCFGNWMDTKVDKLHGYFKQLKAGGIWGLSHDEIKEATNTVWDLFLDNADNCEFYRFFYTGYSWCYDNIETCIFHQGMLNNVLDNGFEMAGSAWKLFRAITHEHQCETDVQTVGRIGQVTEGAASLASTLIGFDSHWSLNTPVEKLSIHQMISNVVAKARTVPHPECPIKKFFEEINPFHNMQPKHHEKEHHNQERHHERPAVPFYQGGFQFSIPFGQPFEIIAGPMRAMHLI